MLTDKQKANRRRWNRKAIERGYYVAYQRKQHKILRSAVLDLLGRSCRKCGFADERALQIDHINGGGHLEIQKGHLPMYRKILANPAGYQTLCANCNWIKRCENNEGKSK